VPDTARAPTATVLGHVIAETETETDHRLEKPETNSADDDDARASAPMTSYPCIASRPASGERQVVGDTQPTGSSYPETGSDVMKLVLAAVHYSRPILSSPRDLLDKGIVIRMWSTHVTVKRSNYRLQGRP